MNQRKQFWALLKFQIGLTSKPFIILTPLFLMFAFHTNSVVSMMVHGYHPALDQLLGNQNIILLLLFGCFILAPDVMRTASISAQLPSGTEFLLTRAVDRRMVIRARAALFYSLLFVTPIVAFPSAIRNPGLQIHEYSSVQKEQILAALPGSAPFQAAGDRNYTNDIVIPNGAMLVETYRYWMLLSLAILTEWYIMFIYPFKDRHYWVWFAYVAAVGIPLALIGHTLNRIGEVGFPEKVFFIFATHQPVVWFFTAAALLLGQLWCERRFASTEH